MVTRLSALSEPDPVLDPPLESPPGIDPDMPVMQTPATRSACFAATCRVIVVSPV